MIMLLGTVQRDGGSAIARAIIIWRVPARTRCITIGTVLSPIGGSLHGIYYFPGMAEVIWLDVWNPSDNVAHSSYRMPSIKFHKKVDVVRCKLRIRFILDWKGGKLQVAG